MGIKILIIGAGPAGLGAGIRLRELGFEDFSIHEEKGFVGGLSASFRDKNGFTWDLGGHVMFSHFPYYDRVVGEALGSDYREIIRESWIRILGRFVPYPFQNNIHRLPQAEREECLAGLRKAWLSKGSGEGYANFEDWILATFGGGIARLFMFPQNRKTWAYPLEKMSSSWIAERVSIADPKRIEENIALNRDDAGWGPNSKFKFPTRGGTGVVFESIGRKINDKIVLSSKLECIDTGRREAYFTGGSKEKFECLISTIPLDKLVSYMSPKREDLIRATRGLIHIGGFIIGIGVKRPVETTKCWMYFPEDACPFYRVTYLSNYSPAITPGPGYHALLSEVSFSRWKREEKDTVIDRTIDGLIQAGLLEESDKEKIATKFLMRVPYTYPVPTLSRDPALSVIQPALEGLGIYSRGRFGSWRYEIGNMDHSFMQGVEIADKLVSGGKEKLFVS